MKAKAKQKQKQKQKQNRKKAMRRLSLSKIETLHFDSQEHFLFSSFDITEEVIEDLILPAKINFFQAYMEMFAKRRKEIFDSLKKKENEGISLINQESTNATTNSR